MINTGSLLAFDYTVDMMNLFSIPLVCGFGLGFLALLIGWFFGWCVKMVFKLA